VADTGLPWELPYPLPTDLVRDGADAIKDLAEATATGLTDASVIRQVVQTVKDDAFSTSTTGSFVAITGLEATITPTSDTSKVLVIVRTTFSSTASSAVVFRMMRGASPIGVSAVGTTNGYAYNNLGAVNTAVAAAVVVDNSTGVFLDSPNTDAATTYSVELNSSASTTFINRRPADTTFGMISTITLIEVAA